MSDDPRKQTDHALLAEATRYHSCGQFSEAANIYTDLLSRYPANADLWINLGAACRAAGKLELAQQALKEAVSLDPEQPGAVYNLANLERQLQQWQAAEGSYRRCLDLAPDFSDATINLAEMLCAQGQVAAAKTALQEGLALNPGQADLWNNLGNAHHSLGELDEAEACLLRALERAPENPAFRRNLGAVYLAAGNHNAASEALQWALEHAPGDAEAHCLRAFSRLASGDFSGGWDDYSWRWKSEVQEPRRPFPQPLWDGSGLAGRSIVVWGEQGIGDEIMYASVLPDVLGLARRVAVECAPRLVPLFRRSFPAALIRGRYLPPDGALLAPDWDLQVPLADLARYFRRQPADFGTPSPFLKCNQAQRDRIRARYRALACGKRLIGVAWKSQAGRTGAGRSLTAADLDPVLNLPDAFFVNLQYGDVTAEMRDSEARCGGQLYVDPEIDQMHDMDGFASQVAALDLVVSAANTTVHVAGALGVTTKVLIPGVADWRWMRDRTDSPWYPSIELYRKAARQSLSGFMMEVAQKINQ